VNTFNVGTKQICAVGGGYGAQASRSADSVFGIGEGETPESLCSAQTGGRNGVATPAAPGVYGTTQERRRLRGARRRVAPYVCQEGVGGTALSRPLTAFQLFVTGTADCD